MTICAVCKQDVPDIAAHVFVCAGVQAAVKKSQEPKTIDAIPVESRSVLRRVAMQKGEPIPTFVEVPGGNIVEHRTVPANQANHDGGARTSDDRSQPRIDAGTVQAPQGKKSIEGAELEHALALIKVLHQYIHEHRNDPTQVVGDNGRQFVYKMNYAMLRYGMKTFVSSAQYNWLRGLEKLIHKAMTDLAPSQ